MYFTRIGANASPKYLYYAALGIPYSMYSTNPHSKLTQEVLGNHKIAVPPLPEQIQIARFLDTRDGAD